MTKRTKRRRSKKRRPDFFQKNKFSLTFMVLAGLVVVSLVMFARMEEEHPPPLVPPIEKPLPKPVVDHTREVRNEVEALLVNVAGADEIHRDFSGKPARYSVEADVPSAELLEGFRQHLARIPGNYSVRVVDAAVIAVEKDGTPQVMITFVPPAVAIPDGPLVTIIMDDLGRSTVTAQSLISIPYPVTLSILPGEAHAAQVAELANEAGHEVMLHSPMEPQGYPAVNPGADALFVNLSSREIRSRFEAQLAAIPHAVGTNNHMGSKFTEDARALVPVMESLSEKKLFFVDSRTTGHTKAAEVAGNYGVPTISRDVFLDNVADVEAITKQIFKLENKARQKGVALGICHPYPETLEALRREMPILAERGITFVPVSVLLRKQARG